MSYQLGIDFGTTFTAAAVRRAAGADEPEVVPLGGRGGAVSSVLHLARDERVTVGEAAAGLAGIDPTRVVRELKRRVGHPEPVVLGAHAWTAEELAARLLRWVVDRVVEQEGAAPARIALAHPPSWAAHTLERLAAALGGQGLCVTFVAEPRAVAHAAAGSAAPGDTIAIHDLGGGRFDAAVLRRETASGGFAILGAPETIGDLGGLDLDELVWQHVRAGLADDVPPVARVRRACTRAKETLSAEHEVVVRIRRGELRGAVRLDRVTFEGMIAPHVDRTVAALRRTIASTGLEPGQLSALLLAGGCARIPLVARAVGEQLGRVPTVHGAPDLVARGAVLALTAPGATVDPGALVSTASGYLAVRPTVDESDPVAPVAAEQAASEASTVEIPAPAAEVPVPARRRAGAVLDPGARRVGRRGLARTLAGVGAVIAAALVLVALFRPDGPLDPPLDPVAGDGAPLTAGRGGAPVPTATVDDTELEADPVPAAVRPADSRPSVTTTPPVAPRALPVGLSPTTGAGATAMTPPPPMA